LGESFSDFNIEQDEDHGGFKIVFNLTKNGQLFPSCLNREVFRTATIRGYSVIAGSGFHYGEAPYSDKGDEASTPVLLESSKALVDHIVTMGKKGLAVQRYKGLGEMNPEQALGNHDEIRKKRTLLQSGSRRRRFG